MQTSLVFLLDCGSRSNIFLPEWQYQAGRVDFVLYKDDRKMMEGCQSDHQQVFLNYFLILLELSVLLHGVGTH